MSSKDLEDKNFSIMSDAVREAFGLSGKFKEEPTAKAEVMEVEEKEHDAKENGINVVSADTITELRNKLSKLDIKTAAKSAKNKTEPESSGVLEIEISKVKRSPYQTREIEGDEELDELSRSIQAKGVIQPVIVRALDVGETYELVAGERRLRAAKLAGLSKIPAIIRDLSDRDAMEISIIENAQRENLNPVEEAVAFKRLIEEFKLTQTDVASVIGKNRTTISNSLRLLQLPDEVKEYLKTAELTAGHARALLQLDSEEKQIKVARKAIKLLLSVRALEDLVSRLNGREEASADEIDEDMERVLASVKRQEQKLAELLGLERVSLRLDDEGRRRLSITFDSEAAWKRFMGRMR